VMLVGTHVSSPPEEVLAIDERVDCVALKEYDQTLVDIAACLGAGGDIGTVAGIAHRVDGTVVRTAPRSYITELDSLPFVSATYKKHLRIEDYFFAAGEYPMAMIMTGRGCTSKCFYCVYPQAFHGHNYRMRSPQSVIDEFEYISRELPQVKSVGIEDDTFTAYPERVKEICRGLIARGIHKKLHWWANTRVSLDLETMTLMKKSGCRLMVPGFESGDQTLLNNMKKGTRLDQAELYVKNAKKVGLLVHGCFMVGNKGETRETMQKTLDFAIKTSPDTAQFFPMIPYPGTAAFKWANENGHLVTTDYSKWLSKEGMHECVVNLPDIPSKDLVSFCDDARKKYYLRPGYMFTKLIQTIRLPQERRRTLKSLRQFAKFLMK
jgi:anaerobic magnesium-protoporphyrin IX monomethyl ester cyclase